MFISGLGSSHFYTNRAVLSQFGFNPIHFLIIIINGLNNSWSRSTNGKSLAVGSYWLYFRLDVYCSTLFCTSQSLFFFRRCGAIYFDTIWFLLIPRKNSSETDCWKEHRNIPKHSFLKHEALSWAAQFLFFTLLEVYFCWIFFRWIFFCCIE